MDRAYQNLSAKCASLDARNPEKYRFDLDTGIAWERVAVPGRYCPPGLLTALGIDAAALRQHGGAHDLFQWAYALTVCQEFTGLENIIVRFLDQQQEVLEETRSAAWLAEEERKHIALFRRYADYLRTVEPYPGAVRDFDAAFAGSAPALAAALDRGNYPSEAEYHYVFWLKVLFFEEYTLYLDERLRAEAQLVQPAWLSAHTAHRREEEQHVVTDMAHLEALGLSDDARETWSRLFVMDFESHARLFLSIDTPWELAASRYPDIVDTVPRRALRAAAVFDDVLSSRTFRRTRAAAPYLARIARAPNRRRKVEVPGRKPATRRIAASWREAFRRRATRLSGRLIGAVRENVQRTPLRNPSREPAPTPRPATRTLAEVRVIWADVLDCPVEAVDPDTSFLLLGGDSVRAVEIHSRIESRYGELLDFEILQSCQTVREFATYLDRHVGPLPDAPAAESLIQSVRSAATDPPMRRSRDIAVIAMAGRFPNAPTLDEFWRMLKAGQSAFVRVPASRWNVDDYYDADETLSGKVACNVGAFLEGVDMFDPEAFGLTEAHALDTDPQQRLFIELAADVLDAAGKISNDIGVFASTGWNMYLSRYAPERIGKLTALGNLHNMVAARVCQVLGLRGPAFTVDAACASSLLAVHLACQSLRAGECDAAIAGGVELLFNPQTYLSFGQARVLSSKGECMPFSQRASGFLLGEGAGVVLLRPIDDAVAAGDRIIAVIKGSAVNNDGGGYSAMSPSPEGQMAVLRKAYRDAGVAPESVTYVEAHGTGTPVGDSVELRALSHVFGEGGPDETCGIGSVKSNIGHLFSAAGIASLIKVLLSFERETLAPIANFDRPHERHHFDRTRFFPVAAAQPWRRRDGQPRRAGVTALGVGGSNCHMILEEAPESNAATTAEPRDAELLQLCAPSEDALATVAHQLSDFLAGNPQVSLGDFCAAANRRSHRFDTRCALVATSVGDLRKQLTATLRPTTARVLPKVMFVFSAPGSQHLAMGRHLYDSESAFRAAFSDCDRLLRGTLPRSLTDVLYEDPRDDSSEIDDIALSQPLIFSFSYALHRWLANLGIRPDGVMGHSAGEYAAACAAGVLDLESGLRLVARRGNLMATCEAGSMTAVFASEARVRAAMAPWATEVNIAAINDPDQVVVSGRSTAVRALAGALEQDGIRSRELAISCAAHSPLMQQARAEFASAFSSIELHDAKLPVYSTLLGRRADARVLASAEYWLDHLTDTVRFQDAIGAATADGFNVFVEVGPSSGLSHSIRWIHPERDSSVVAVPINSRSERGWAPTLRGLASLYELGLPWDASALARNATPVSLPPYPYRKRRFWIGSDAPLPAPPRGLPAADDESTRPLSCKETRSFEDHVIWDRPIAPGAFLMEQCIRGARDHGFTEAALQRVLIGRSLDLDSFGGTNRLRFAEQRGAQMVMLESWDDQACVWNEHIQAEVVGLDRGSPEVVDLSAVRERCSEVVDIDAMYAVFENDSVALGPAIKTAIGVQRGQREVLAWLSSPLDVQPSTRFAGLVDGAFHSIAALSVGQDAGSFVYLSFSAERVDHYAELPAECLAHVKLLGDFDLTSPSLRCDVTIVDNDGRVLLRLDHVGLRRATPERARADAPPAIGHSMGHEVDAYAVAWKPAPLALDAPIDAVERYVVLTRRGELSPVLVSLRRRLEDEASMVQVARLPETVEGFPSVLERLRPENSAILCVDPDIDQLRALVQALFRRKRPSCRELTVLGPNRMNAAFLQAVVQEEPGWPCRAILVDSARPPADPVHLAGNLVRELRTSPERFTVSYETGERAVPRLEEVSASGYEPNGDGWYWITGGGGAIGRALAADLVQRGARKLLLSARSAEPSRELMAELEASGAEVLYRSADVTDEDALAAACAAATERFGTLRAAFHLAGVVEDKLVWSQTHEAARKLLAPKVAGAAALLSVIGDRDVDFVALFSSYVSQFGRAGQSDYAAANAALDQAAWDAPARPIVSLNWFPWSVGMAGSEGYQRAVRSQGLIPLHPASALSALFRVVQSGRRQIVMAALQPGRSPSLHDEFQAVKWERPALRVENHARAAGGAAVAAGDVEQFLRSELAALLKIDPSAVGTNEPFPDLGIESLSAVNLIRKIEDRFEIPLYPTLLFEITTLNELARYLNERLSE